MIDFIWYALGLLFAAPVLCLAFGGILDLYRIPWPWFLFFAGPVCVGLVGAIGGVARLWPWAVLAAPFVIYVLIEEANYVFTTQ